jgi:hypothetical protein
MGLLSGHPLSLSLSLFEKLSVCLYDLSLETQVEWMRHELIFSLFFFIFFLEKIYLLILS